MGWRREWKYQEDSIGKNIDGWNNRKGIEWNGWRNLKSITQMDSKTLIKSLSYHCVVIGIASVTGFRRFFHCQFIHFIPQWLFGSENKSFPANAVSVSSSSHCSHAKQNTQMDQNAVANLFIIMLYFCLHFVSFQLTWFHFEIIGKI